MLKLKELRISGIGRFVEEQIINFDSLGNLVQVDGQNNNTGGSSGAGKSTVFHALDYLFGLNHIPSTVLKCRYSDKGISVCGIFDFDGKPLTISRGKKLLIDLDGTVVIGSSAITEAKLDEILGIPRDLFHSMLHKRQRQGGFFLNLTPKDINDFLTSCLGLGHFKSKIEIIDKKIKTLADSKTLFTSSLEAANAGLKATKDASSSVGPAPVKDIDQSTILRLKENSQKSKNSLTEILATQKSESEALTASRPPMATIPFDRSVIEVLEVRWSLIGSQITALEQKERDRQGAANKLLVEAKTQKVSLEAQVAKGKTSSEEMLKLAGEIRKIRENLCPRCEQVWATEKAKADELDLLSKIKKLKENVDIANEATEKLGTVNLSIELLKKDVMPIEIPEIKENTNSIKELSDLLVQERQKERDYQIRENAKNKIVLDEFAEKQKSMAYAHMLMLNQHRGQEDVDRKAFDVALGKLKSYEEARVRHESYLLSLGAQEASYTQKVKEAEASLEKITKELEMAEELKRAIKSFLSCSFDGALETISEDATKRIRSIPNMANTTIQLEGMKTTQDGKIKEEVNAVIHMDGEENVDIRSLCGGERTSADLAIDLAVIELIENRANKGIDIFVLDEPFDGLDTVCIEMALEVLKSSSVSKRLIIVDHNPEVKQMVESRLVVVRDGLTSKILQS